MEFDAARFGRLLSGLGLSSATETPGKKVFLFQGSTDLVAFEGDLLEVRGTEIAQSQLRPDASKLSFQELESIIGLSERIRSSGLPALVLELRVEGKVRAVFPQLSLKRPVFSHSHSQLTGLPASPGNVTGSCLVSEDTESPTGKILVLKNSRSLIHLLQRRPLGIILEEGNLLSHASILAREARIPAIVNVRDATKYLSDGDRVELDAGNGTVRNLSRR